MIGRACRTCSQWEKQAQIREAYEFAYDILNQIYFTYVAMKTYGKWTIVLGLLGTSAFASNGDATNAGAGASPAAVVPGNSDRDLERHKQTQDRLKSAQKEYKDVLEAFPRVKQLQISYNKANESYDRIVAVETGAIKNEMSRVWSKLQLGTEPHLTEFRNSSFAISMAMVKSINDIESLRQQIASLAAATNDLAAANSNRVVLEAEIAEERQKLGALQKKRAELAPQSAIESVGGNLSNRKALEREYGLLQRQLWETANTNTNLRNARAELDRWRSQLELAISTNAPLKAAKYKLESAYKESRDPSTAGRH